MWHTAANHIEGHLDSRQIGSRMPVIEAHRDSFAGLRTRHRPGVCQAIASLKNGVDGVCLNPGCTAGYTI